MDPLIALAVAIGFVAGLLAVALRNWIWPKETPMDSSPTVANLRAQLAAQEQTISKLDTDAYLDGQYLASLRKTTSEQLRTIARLRMQATADMEAITDLRERLDAESSHQRATDL